MMRPANTTKQTKAAAPPDPSVNQRRMRRRNGRLRTFLRVVFLLRLAMLQL